MNELNALLSTESIHSDDSDVPEVPEVITPPQKIKPKITIVRDSQNRAIVRHNRAEIKKDAKSPPRPAPTSEDTVEGHQKATIESLKNIVDELEKTVKILENKSEEQERKIEELKKENEELKKKKKENAPESERDSTRPITYLGKTYKTKVAFKQFKDGIRYKIGDTFLGMPTLQNVKIPKATDIYEIIKTKDGKPTIVKNQESGELHKCINLTIDLLDKDNMNNLHIYLMEIIP